MNRRQLLKSASLGGVVPFFRDAQALPGRPSESAVHPATDARLLTAICAYSYRGQLHNGSMHYEDLVRIAAELNVDGLDLTVYWFPNVSDDFLFSLRRLAYRKAVDLYSIAIRTSLCCLTPESRQAEVIRFNGWVDVAQKLGARHIRVSGGHIPEGTPAERVTESAVETLKSFADQAGEHGLVLGLENDGPVTDKAEQVLSIVRQVNSPWVGINVDVGNFRTDPYRQIELCAPYAVNVHFKPDVMDDGNPEPADWNRLLTIFAGVYRGHLALEYEGEGNAATRVPQLMNKLQQMLPKYANAPSRPFTSTES